MLALIARARVRRRILGVALVAVAVLSGVSTSSAAETTLGDPDDGEVLGINSQGQVFPGTPPSELPRTCIFSHRYYEPEPSTRVQLGLSEKSADELTRGRDERGETTFGVTLTTDEYEQIEATMERRRRVPFQEIRPALTKAFENEFVGAAWTSNGDDVVIYHAIESEGDEVVRQALRELVPSDVSITSVFVENGVSWKASTTNMWTLQNGPEAWFDPKSGIAEANLDESCGQVVIYAHPGAEIVKLAEEIGEVIPSDQFLLFPYPSGHEEELAARNNHHNPHRGGTQVFIGNGSGNCTSNIPWHKNNTETWAVTAGHCVNHNSPGAGDWFTVAQQTTQGSVRIDDGGTNPVVYVNYSGGIDAAVTRINIGGDRETHIGTDPADSWRRMNWWQWDPDVPNNHPAGIGWDAIGDTVCQGGWGTRLLRCGTVTARFHLQNSGAEDIFPGHNATLINQRQATTDGCLSDSGGTFYRTSDRTITGVLARIQGTPEYERFGNNCRPNTEYGHISYLRNAFGLTAPVTMS